MTVATLIDSDLDLTTCDLTVNENFVAFAVACFGEKWQKPFADTLGVSQSLLSQIKNGHLPIKRKLKNVLDRLDRIEMLNNKPVLHVMPNRHTHFPPMANQPRRVYVEPKIDEATLKEQIERRFVDCFEMAKTVVDGKVPSIIITGDPGFGKSYGVNKLIVDSDVEHRLIKGTASNVNLYKTLYAMKDGGIVVLDDADSVFNDEATLNTLKAATDSSEKRIISYEKRLPEIEDGTFPAQFEFNGGMIFISNKDFWAEIDRGTKDAKHLRAMIDRSYLIDIGIRTHAEKMVRLRQGVYEYNMLDSFGITDVETAGSEILEFIDNNAKSFDQISFRLLLAIGRLYKANNSHWQRLALLTKGR